MPAFARSTFTAANGTTIAAYVGELSTQWLPASWNQAGAPTIQGNKLRFPGVTFNRRAYFADRVPPSPNYSMSVERTTEAANALSRVMAGVRTSTAAQTGYYGGFDSGVVVAIWKWVAGTPTQVAGPMNCTQPAATDWYAELDVRETSATETTLSLFVQRKSDGEWLSAANTFSSTRVACLTFVDNTGTRITAAGRPGIWCETGGSADFDIDNVLADDGVVEATLSGPATLDGPTAAGGLTSVAPSTLSGAATLDGPAAAGTLGVAPGILTSLALRRNNGTIAAGVALDWLTILVDGTGAFVATKTGIVTNGAGVFTTSDAGMAPGTVYRAVWREAGGQRGHGWAAAT